VSEYTQTAERTLRRLDKPVARRVMNQVEEIAELDDPRSRGKPLTGPLRGLWRWRVGDWRVIAEIHDDRLVILVIDVDHRSQVYS
jgi:mRNA interferase RelE/StbE